VQNQDGMLKNAWAYVKDSYDEMRNKVTWPKYKELQNSSFLVLVASLIFALIIGLIDLAFKNIMEWFYNAF
jgi:preprotein translocase subunit SecE